MKFAIRLLLIGTLAVGSWSCNKGNAPNESVSANGDQTQRSGQPEPNQLSEAVPELLRFCSLKAIN